MKTIAEVFLLCSQQEIGLRGHKESEDSLNRGNFLEILKLVALELQFCHVVIKSMPVGWEFFALVQAVYTLISTPKSHSVFLKIQKELCPDKQVHQLQQLSDLIPKLLTAVCTWSGNHISLETQP